MKQRILFLVMWLAAIPAWAEVEVIILRHRSVEEVLPVIRPLLDKDGAASGMNNRLILRSSLRNIEEIRRLLPDIDTALRQLRITVLQNVDTETARQLAGLSGSVSDGGARIGVGGTGGGGLTVETRRGADSLRANVLSTRSLEQDKLGQEVQVMEGGRAFISIGQAQPVQQRQVVQSPWGTRVTESTQYIETGSGFYVIPRLNGERVTLEIAARNDSPAPGDPAVTRMQRLNTSLSGRLGEWLVLGDVTRQTESGGSTISTRELASTHEQRNVLLMVEEIQ